jgi:hypothetical protein
MLLAVCLFLEKVTVDNKTNRDISSRPSFLLIFASFYNWHCWMAWGQYVHLFWVILSSVLAAIAIFQASVFVLQIVDKWYFMHKAKRSGV